MFDGAEQHVIEEAISPYMVLGMLWIMPVQRSVEDCILGVVQGQTTPTSWYMADLSSVS